MLSHAKALRRRCVASWAHHNILRLSLDVFLSIARVLVVRLVVLDGSGYVHVRVGKNGLCGRCRKPLSGSEAKARR